MERSFMPISNDTINEHRWLNARLLRGRWASGTTFDTEGMGGLMFRDCRLTDVRFEGIYFGHMLNVFSGSVLERVTFDAGCRGLAWSDFDSAELDSETTDGLFCYPREGAFTAYKKVYVRERGSSDEPYEYPLPPWSPAPKWAILRLKVPASAARASRPACRKLRVSCAKVVSAWAPHPCAWPTHRLTRIKDTSALKLTSMWDSGFEYVVGRVVRPACEFDHDRDSSCSSGIHCFMTLEEALAFG